MSKYRKRRQQLKQHTQGFDRHSKSTTWNRKSERLARLHVQNVQAGRTRAKAAGTVVDEVPVDVAREIEIEEKA